MEASMFTDYYEILEIFPNALPEEAGNTKGIERDVVTQDKLLSILYVKAKHQ